MRLHAETGLIGGSSTAQHKHVAGEMMAQEHTSTLLVRNLGARDRPGNNQVCLLFGDKPEDSKIVKLSGDDWQEVHTGAFWSARTGDRFAVLG